MRRFQNLLLLEPNEMTNFFLNVVFLEKVKTCFYNPQKHEKNLAQSWDSSAHTFPESPCILNGLKWGIFQKCLKKPHLKYIKFLKKCVPTCLETGPNFFHVSESYKNTISLFLEIQHSKKIRHLVWL